MLVEMAIGDAYGMGFEYADAEFVKEKNKLTHYVKHRLHKIAPGHYTDDTQMAIAIAELLVSKEPWRPSRIAGKFLEVFHRDERTGYAGGFYKFLKETNDADEFLKNMRPNSNKSGGAMRAPPIGVLPDEEDVIQYATIQAQITHNTPEGIDAARAAALMAHYFFHDRGPKADVGKWLEGRVDGEWSKPYDIPVGSPGWQSVRAAITAIVKSSKLSEVLFNSVAVTGDVDTVAAIAMACAAHSTEIKNDLADYPFLAGGLENGEYGRDYLTELNGKLVALGG